MKKKIVSIFLSAVIATGVLWCVFGADNGKNTAVSAADSITELEEKQAELEKQNAKYQQNLEKNAKEIKKQKEYQEALVGKIDTVNEQIITSQEKIDTLTAQINAKTKKISKLNKDIEERMDTLRSRIKTIYMSGDVSSLEIILGAKDFNDFLDKVELVRNVSNYDEKLIKEIESDMDAVKAEKKTLQSDKKKQVKEQAVLQTKRDEIQELIDENTQVLETLYTRNKAQEAAIKKNNGALNGIDEEIAQYYADLAKKQQQQQQNSNNNNSNSGGGGNSTVVVPTGDGYCWPVPGFTALSSTYGEDRGSYGHGAIDISSAGIMGATVVAADGGTVVVSENSCTHNWAKSGSCGCGGGYGNYVWIDHGNGKCTIYGHLTKSVVSAGQTVSKGQVIGYVGSTGWSSGPHLHFECRYNGVKYDPMSEY